MKIFARNILLLTLLTSASVGRCSATGFPDLYNEINSLDYAKDRSGALRFLAKLDNTNVSSFGAWLRPTDAQQMQLVAMQLFPRFLLSNSGGPAPVVQRLTNGTGDEYGEWLKFFSILPSDEKGLLQMLQDKNLAVRWLGLLKADFLKKGAPTLTKAIGDIAARDPYVIVSGFSAPLTDHPDQIIEGPDSYGFTAPVREKAIKVLKKWGQEVVIDSDAVNRQGMAHLKKLYLESPEQRADVLDDIWRLRNNDKVMYLLENQAPATEEEKKMIEEFKEESKGPRPSSADPRRKRKVLNRSI